METGSRATAAGEEFLGRFMPHSDLSTHHCLWTAAGPEAAYRALQEVDLGRSFLIRWLFRLRGLPASAHRLDGLQELGFILLDEHPPSRVVLGLVGRFWTLRGDPRRLPPREFRGFSDPGTAKTLWAFWIEPEGTGSRLHTATRVCCSDEASLRRFRAYWRLVGPFSGIIRRRMLALIKERAEGESR